MKPSVSWRSALAGALLALGCAREPDPFAFPQDADSSDTEATPAPDGASADTRDGGPADTRADTPMDSTPDLPDDPGEDVPEDVPPRMVTGGAGSACSTDTDCASSRLTCEDFTPGGFCTAACTNNRLASAEQAQCGGRGSTCLTQGDTMPRSICARACDPSARTEATGACHPSQVCTGWWYTRTAGPDEPGCIPFCTTDAHCGGMEPRCNVRVGACRSTGHDPTAFADGQPCNPTLTRTVPGETTPRNVQCRGVCFGVNSRDRTQGICGSLVNLRVATRCPDAPERITPLTSTMGMDNLAICIFQSCTRDADCPAPLSCNPTMGRGMLCLYPMAP